MQVTKPHSAASAYSAASQTVSSLRAVVMLYDGMIQAVNAAKSAIRDNRLEDRFRATQKACKILLGLQANLDFEKGGEISPMLDQFYHGIFRDLQRINLSNAESDCEEVIAALKEVRMSWARLAEDQDPMGGASAERRRSCEGSPANDPEAGLQDGLGLSV